LRALLRCGALTAAQEKAVVAACVLRCRDVDLGVQRVFVEALAGGSSPVAVQSATAASFSANKFRRSRVMARVTTAGSFAPNQFFAVMTRLCEIPPDFPAEPKPLPPFPAAWLSRMVHSSRIVGAVQQVGALKTAAELRNSSTLAALWAIAGCVKAHNPCAALFGCERRGIRVQQRVSPLPKRWCGTGCAHTCIIVAALWFWLSSSAALSPSHVAS
jgi:hypothetical protein